MEKKLLLEKNLKENSTNFAANAYKKLSKVSTMKSSEKNFGKFQKKF